MRSGFDRIPTSLRFITTFDFSTFLGEDGAKFEHDTAISFKMKKAFECLNESGDPEEATRIREMSMQDFLREFAPGWNQP